MGIRFQVSIPFSLSHPPRSIDRLVTNSQSNFLVIVSPPSCPLTAPALKKESSSLPASLHVHEALSFHSSSPPLRETNQTGWPFFEIHLYSEPPRIIRTLARFCYLVFRSLRMRVAAVDTCPCRTAAVKQQSCISPLIRIS